MVRLKNLVGSYTISKRNGQFITLLDCTGQKIDYNTFCVCGGNKQSAIKYEYGELKTHVKNVIDWGA